VDNISINELCSTFVFCLGFVKQWSRKCEGGCPNLNIFMYEEHYNKYGIIVSRGQNLGIKPLKKKSSGPTAVPLCVTQQ